jgi:hypothetical protein
MIHGHSLCANPYFFCFFLFVCLFVFSILANLYINFETGKWPAHERNNFIFHVNMHFCNIVLFHKCRYWVLATQCIILYKIVQFCGKMSKHVSCETIFIWYGIRLQVNVVPQCRNTLQYVVSYVKFLEDFAQTKYCSSNEKKIHFFVEYDTLDRIYKFEDKQMKTGMTLGHKCFVTQFSTKEVLYYDDFLKNYWKFLHGLLDSHINYL